MCAFFPSLLNSRASSWCAICLFAAGAAPFFTPSTALAETAVKSRCFVDVRSLKGSTPKKDESARLEAGEFLSDIKSQLESLPFARFETVNHERQIIPLHETGIFRIPGSGEEASTLFVEVECVHRDGARVKLEWNESSETNILSTNLRLTNGQNWLLGTDNNDELSSTIVSVKVDCGDEEAKDAESDSQNKEGTSDGQ